MKIAKIFPMIAVAALLAGATACSDVTDPVYHEPNAANFTLNTPPLQDQYFELTPNGTFEIVCNGQPDYGFSAITNYQVEVSLTSDFAEYKTLTPTGTGTLSRMTLKCSDLAIAMCQLHGTTSDEDYVDHGIEPVYFRGVAFINGIESSYVTTSNVVSLNKVQGYFALPVPGYIFCIGNYAGSWIGPEAGNAEALRPYRVTEKADEIGSKVYYATIDFNSTDVDDNGCIFRFYTELSGWDNTADKTVSYGPAGGTDSDTPVEFPDFVAGSTLTHNLVGTKDSFKFNNYKGVLNMVVDFSGSNPKVTFTTGE